MILPDPTEVAPVLADINFQLACQCSDFTKRPLLNEFRLSYHGGRLGLLLLAFGHIKTVNLNWAQ